MVVDRRVMRRACCWSFEFIDCKINVLEVPFMALVSCMVKSRGL